MLDTVNFQASAIKIQLLLLWNILVTTSLTSDSRSLKVVQIFILTHMKQHKILKHNTPKHTTTERHSIVQNLYIYICISPLNSIPKYEEAQIIWRNKFSAKKFSLETIFIQLGVKEEAVKYVLYFQAKLYALHTHVSACTIIHRRLF